jgi:hypothetical protein
MGGSPHVGAGPVQHTGVPEVDDGYAPPVRSAGFHEPVLGKVHRPTNDHSRSLVIPSDSRRRGAADT